MMRKLAVVADYLNDSHRAHIEKMATVSLDICF